ncbi:NAD(P)H-binding protein [Puniceibacterium confluentis]|uniref:NAD(P)H-binding protein n=1 Tax=Puniceibacterium confluentis TaxID=1958944 RepID=UPI0035697BEC
MIAVTGATGQLGRLVIDALADRVPSASIVAAVRRPAAAADLAARGFVVREADYDRPATLEAAFAGVRTLLLISSSDIGKRVAQHRAVIAAARAAGVTRIVYTSILGAADSPLMLAAEHRASEADLAASGLEFVLLRNGWYLENYQSAVGMAVQHGAVLGAAQSGQVSAAARRDYADAAASVLLRDDVPTGQVYELSGDSAFTMADLAAEIAGASGRQVSYVDMTPADYAGRLKELGLPDGLADVLADSDAGLAQGGLYGDSGDLAALIGRPTTAMPEFVVSALKG